MAEETIDISIEGMTCDHCVKAVSSALLSVDGVQAVDVALAEKKARVTYDDSRCKSDELQAVLHAEGYAGQLYGSKAPTFPANAEGNTGEPCPLPEKKGNS